MLSYSAMHLILVNSLLLLLLPNPTLQDKVMYVTSRQIIHSQYWASQTCSNVAATNCCAPLDLNVPGVGRGWFCGMYLRFSQLLPVSLYLSVWPGKAQDCGIA